MSNYSITINNNLGPVSIHLSPYQQVIPVDVNLEITMSINRSV